MDRDLKPTAWGIAPGRRRRSVRVSPAKVLTPAPWYEWRGGQGSLAPDGCVTGVAYWLVGVAAAGWMMTVPAFTWPPLLGAVKSGRTLTRSPVVTSACVAATDFW
jgi:hypothetical protein